MLKKFRRAARTVAHHSVTPVYGFGALAARLTLRTSRPGGKVHNVAMTMLFKAALHTRHAQRRAMLLAKHQQHLDLRLQAKFGLPVSPTVPQQRKAADNDATLGIG